MNHDRVDLTLKRGRETARVEGDRVVFNAGKCFAFDDGPDDINCLRVLGAYLIKQPSLAVYGKHPLLSYLLRHVPELRSAIRCIISDGDAVSIAGIPVVNIPELSEDVQTVFLCETQTFQRWKMRKRLPQRVKAVEPDILVEVALDVLPVHAWTPTQKNIYPIDVPDVKFEKGLDLLLLDCPARNLALMPNGLGYIHNALKKSSVTFQTFDLDIVAYHRFHICRLFDEGGTTFLPSGKELPGDPWLAEHYDLWADPEVMAYFDPFINEIVAALVEARPKIIGFSIHFCNEAFTRKIVNAVKVVLPETLILVGGYSCTNPEMGLLVFPEFDYMCIGEGDLTVGPLVKALAQGERPRDLPGVLSRFDTPSRKFTPGSVVENLDSVDFPRYDWFDLSLYRNYNDYQLTPIIASRGCLWSRCTFCAERFYWRIRTAKNFVDEMEWLVGQGCNLFMFNESDLNGIPDKLLEICDEIIARKLNIKLTGQLRVHKKSDRKFFDKLRKAGFVTLRFGVDAFSTNTLRLQMKGYTTKMISQNLKDCWEAGIFTEVNWVVGVPGETDEDITEGIDLILQNQKYIGRLENINPLIFSRGSVYWEDPAAHNIVFRKPQEEIFKIYSRAVPADMWYSTEPYIDAQVRKNRIEKIMRKLHAAGFPTSAWAARIIDDVESSRDEFRAGGTEVCGNTHEKLVAKEAVVQQRQQVSGDHYRVDNIASVPKIIRHAGYCYVVDEQALQVAFDKKSKNRINKFRGMNTVFAGETLPDVTVIKVKDRGKRSGGNSPVVIETDFKGFNILFFKGKYYAVSQSLGDIVLSRILESRLLENLKANEIYIDEDLLEVERWIEQSGMGGPEVIETNFKGFNILFFKRKYYAVSQSLGDIDLARIEESRLLEVLKVNEIYIDENLLELERWIERSGMGGPEVIETDFKGFNILSYKRKYYAISQSLGDFNLARIEEGRLFEVLKANEMYIDDDLLEVKDWLSRPQRKVERLKRAVVRRIRHLFSNHHLQSDTRGAGNPY